MKPNRSPEPSGSADPGRRYADLNGRLATRLPGSVVTGPKQAGQGQFVAFQQGWIVSVEQGEFVALKQGWIVSVEQGEFVSVEQGEFVLVGQGQFVAFQQGGIVSVEQGEFVSVG